MIDILHFFFHEKNQIYAHLYAELTVNFNETRLREIFRQGEGCLLDITSELVLRRKDLERLCCASTKKGRKETIKADST